MKPSLEGKRRLRKLRKKKRREENETGQDQLSDQDSSQSQQKFEFDHQKTASSSHSNHRSADPNKSLPHFGSQNRLISPNPLISIAKPKETAQDTTQNPISHHSQSLFVTHRKKKKSKTEVASSQPFSTNDPPLPPPVKKKKKKKKLLQIVLNSSMNSKLNNVAKSPEINSKIKNKRLSVLQQKPAVKYCSSTPVQASHRQESFNLTGFSSQKSESTLSFVEKKKKLNELLSSFCMEDSTPEKTLEVSSGKSLSQLSEKNASHRKKKYLPGQCSTVRI